MKSIKEIITNKIKNKSMKLLIEQPIDMIEWYWEITLAVLSFLYHFSGLKFVIRKFCPRKPNTLPLPTGFLWLIGLYAATFGIASQIYENRIDIIENRANAIFPLLAIEKTRKLAIAKIPRIQIMLCPVKPEFFVPISIWNSLLGKQNTYKEIVEQLKETIELLKNDLEGVNLSKALLSGADLSNANLSGANLLEADLFEADLSGTHLFRANLFRANLFGANLNLSNLPGADLREANLREAYLKGTMNLTVEQLSEAKTLYKAELDPEAMKQIKEKYPHLLEKPKHSREINEHRDFVRTMDRLFKKEDRPIQ